MTVRKQFEKHFSENNLKTVFNKYVVYSGGSGLDNLNQSAFQSQLDSQVEILSRKVLAGSYRFTKYKLKLVSKGRRRYPREISIPTIRDRIALRAMCDFLTERYSENVKLDLPQEIIKQVKQDVLSNEFDGYVKLDVVDFYPSIRHDVLTKRLYRKVRNRQIINFIVLAVKPATVSISRTNDADATIGIPQGLAISNILAAVYLENIDNQLEKISDIKCYRYVDDILIFCRFDDTQKISDDVIKRFSKVGLTIHAPNKDTKSVIGCINGGFDYLGYRFEGKSITVRPTTVEKLKASLAAIFTRYKYSKKPSLDFLLWRLNLRITGCVFENKSKGWLFFFSEINDEGLLHSLDNYVKKLCNRFEVSVMPKKFVRAFKELSHRRHETSYIPNFDKYDLNQKRDVLKRFFSHNLSGKTNEEIEKIFKMKISRQVKDLLADIKEVLGSQGF